MGDRGMTRLGTAALGVVLLVPVWAGAQTAPASTRPRPATVRSSGNAGDASRPPAAPNGATRAGTRGQGAAAPVPVPLPSDASESDLTIAITGEAPAPSQPAPQHTAGASDENEEPAPRPSARRYAP